MLSQIERPECLKDDDDWPRKAREIYHIAMSYILKPFTEACERGRTIHCGDGIRKSIFPRFPIITQDLMEQYVSDAIMYETLC
jgi:hypothetical protein